MIIGLGPLPTKPSVPFRSQDQIKNTATSIEVSWNNASNEILTVSKYTLHMDDGFGVNFNPVFEGFETSYTITGLTSGVSYSFYLTTTNFNG